MSYEASTSWKGFNLNQYVYKWLLSHTLKQGQLINKLEYEVTQLKRGHQGPSEEETLAKRDCTDPAELAMNMEMAEAVKLREVNKNRTELGLHPTCPPTGILATMRFSSTGGQLDLASGAL